MSEPKKYWLNKDLAEYFENVPLDVFRAYSIRGGLEEGCDINIVHPFLENTKSLIEIGASYGRVILDHQVF